jgi:hypothetical protein
MIDALIWLLALIGAIYIVATILGLVTLIASLAAISHKRRKVVGKGIAEVP